MIEVCALSEILSEIAVFFFMIHNLFKVLEKAWAIRKCGWLLHLRIPQRSCSCEASASGQKHLSWLFRDSWLITQSIVVNGIVPGFFAEKTRVHSFIFKITSFWRRLFVRERIPHPCREPRSLSGLRSVKAISELVAHFQRVSLPLQGWWSLLLTLNPLQKYGAPKLCFEEDFFIRTLVSARPFTKYSWIYANFFLSW